MLQTNAAGKITGCNPSEPIASVITKMSSIESMIAIV
jgi:hypothetical protein